MLNDAGDKENTATRKWLECWLQSLSPGGNVSPLNDDIKTSKSEASDSSPAVDYKPKAANKRGRDEVGQLLLVLTEKCGMRKGLQPSYFKEFIWQ